MGGGEGGKNGGKRNFASSFLGTMAVAVLGTGLLGSGFVRGLRKRGVEVHCWNRSADKAKVRTINAPARAWAEANPLRPRPSRLWAPRRSLAPPMPSAALRVSTSSSPMITLLTACLRVRHSFPGKPILQCS